MSRQYKHDFLIKLLLIGDAGVGKTSLLSRFFDDSYQSSYTKTVGLDFKIKTFEIEGKKIKLQLWDGYEEKNYDEKKYRGTMGILFVYDVTDEKSFNNIDLFINNSFDPSNIVNKILIGNKYDMPSVISSKKGQALADKHNIKFLETSAKNNLNITKAFETIILDVKHRLYDDSMLIYNYQQYINLRDPKNNNNKNNNNSCF